MNMRILKSLVKLDLEEQFLNGGALIALLSLFLPWISGEWLGGDTITYSGFGFYTSFLGFVIFLLLLFILVITLLPLAGGPVLVKKRHREFIRFIVTLQTTVLVLASLSVLTKVTFEFSRMEVRFGIYLCLIGNLIALLYAFLGFQEYRKSQVHELFHHPEDQAPPSERKENAAVPPPPPPPPPSAPEEHRLYP